MRMLSGLDAVYARFAQSPTHIVYNVLFHNRTNSFASRPAAASDTIAGEIADRSLKNYMLHLAGNSKSGSSANSALSI
jgi:hypothetical protein